MWCGVGRAAIGRADGDRRQGTLVCRAMIGWPGWAAVTTRPGPPVTLSHNHPTNTLHTLHTSHRRNTAFSEISLLLHSDSAVNQFVLSNFRDNRPKQPEMMADRPRLIPADVFRVICVRHCWLGGLVSQPVSTRSSAPLHPLSGVPAGRVTVTPAPAPPPATRAKLNQ